MVLSDQTFQNDVLHVVANIPEGFVATYGQIARLIGKPRTARAIGRVLHNNPYPITIPCHRVVFSDGKLAQHFAFGGEQAQRQLLEQEGVGFTPSGRVDMKEYQWRA